MQLMIFLSDTYSNRHILSLRTGGPIGFASWPIINYKNLKIEGWHAKAHGEKGAMILPVGELRDIIAKGLVVNDHDAITPAEDMIRLKDVIDEEYELIGSSVETETGSKLGKVTDYAVENKTLFVQKLYISQNILRSLSSLTKPQLIIDRSQIIDVTSEKIVVKEASEKVRSTGAATAKA